MTDDPSTRDRLVAAMADALQRRGLHGTGLAELLARARAPKGVLYHHFPGGKTELAVAAIERAVERFAGSLDRLAQRPDDPAAALRQWLEGARRVLETSDFERGCPLATVALESTAEDVALRAALSRGFATIRDRLAAAFARAGVGAAQAAPLASLVVSAYEGGLLQARVAADARPMLETTDMLIRCVVAHLPAPRDAAPPSEEPNR